MLIVAFYPYYLNSSIKKWKHRNPDIDTWLYCAHGGGPKQLLIQVEGKDLKKIRRIFHYLRHIHRRDAEVRIWNLDQVDPSIIYRKLPHDWPLNVHDIVDKTTIKGGELNRHPTKEAI